MEYFIDQYQRQVETYNDITASSGVLDRERFMTFRRRLLVQITQGVLSGGHEPGSRMEGSFAQNIIEQLVWAEQIDSPVINPDDLSRYYQERFGRGVDWSDMINMHNN